VPLTKQRFNEWKRLDDTQEVFKEMREARSEFLEYLITGTATKILNDDQQNHDYMIFNIGVLYGIDLLLEMRIEDEQKSGE